MILLSLMAQSSFNLSTGLIWKLIAIILISISLLSLKKTNVSTKCVLALAMVLAGYLIPVVDGWPISLTLTLGIIKVALWLMGGGLAIKGLVEINANPKLTAGKSSGWSAIVISIVLLLLFGRGFILGFQRGFNSTQLHLLEQKDSYEFEDFNLMINLPEDFLNRDPKKLSPEPSIIFFASKKNSSLGILVMAEKLGVEYEVDYPEAAQTIAQKMEKSTQGKVRMISDPKLVNTAQFPGIQFKFINEIPKKPYIGTNWIVFSNGYVYQCRVTGLKEIESEVLEASKTLIEGLSHLDKLKEYSDPNPTFDE